MLQRIGLLMILMTFKGAAHKGSALQLFRSIAIDRSASPLCIAQHRIKAIHSGANIISK